MKYVIGITGNIGTGKSTVLRMLEKLGAKAIDADELVHRVMAKGTPVWEAIAEAFGKEMLGRDGEIDRERLGTIVFSDPGALKRLEGIVHPAVERLIWEIAEEAQEPVVVIEAIKLIEAGAQRRCDALWVVTCRPEQQWERLSAQGLSEEQIRKRMEAQGPASAKIELADLIIDNSGSREETWAQVRREWERIKKIEREGEKR